MRGEGGRFVPGTFFSQYFKEFDYAIERFQVVEVQAGALVLRIARGGRFSQDILDAALATFRKHLGEGTRIDVEIVEGGAGAAAFAQPDAVIVGAQ